MVSLQSTFGSAFIGLVVSAILYGVTILQTYLYYRNYPEDSKILKWMVAILWIFDTVHLALCTVAVYWVLVLNFNNPAVLETTTWSMNVQTDFNGLIGLIVECFYCRRVWIGWIVCTLFYGTDVGFIQVSRNIYLTLVILVLSLIHFALGIVFTVGSFETSRSQFSSLIWVTSAGLGSSAAADMLIGISLCYYLSKNRTGFSRTDNLISTLMKYSLTTGFLTGIVACLVVITFATMPNNFVYLAFVFLQSKCYVNSVLAALNSRESLRERAHPPGGSFLDLSAVPSGGISAHSRRKPSLAVNFETAIISKADHFALPPSASTTASVTYAPSSSTSSPLPLRCISADSEI
ncbi:hypothetical protein B0H17DRAFT_417550 [Mycena rosella]|uniref:DUF6534 domain-containing protein n=1 Tax=Mycena rosella TaxID=1033263 RepID=A0AAD7DPA8_MYCRO|nr:hypothetical protein B0H17DRAFT_417550 [Mycena rosella]